MKILDPKEAPEGFYAKLKSDYTNIATNNAQLGNYCKHCDWRYECNDIYTDLTIHNHRCMEQSIVLSNGATLERKDRCSVVFKKSNS